MTLAPTSMTCHVVPALGPWCSFTLTFALPEAVSVPDPVHELGSFLVPLLDPLSLVFLFFLRADSACSIEMHHMVVAVPVRVPPLAGISGTGASPVSVT